MNNFKKFNSAYTPFLLENLLNDKQVSFQNFFNLEDIPDNIKRLEKSFTLIKELRFKSKDAISESKNVIKCCDGDFLSDAKKSATEVSDIISNLDYDIDELEKIIQQWEISYESLENLVKEILNKENIDLTKYSTNMTESELKSYKRIKTINNLLKDE